MPVSQVPFAGISNPVNFRNRIINGNMQIDQRNAGASITSGYAVDRWASYFTQASKVTLQQNAASVTPPIGYQNYYGITSSSAYSVLSSDLFEIYQNIEGYNVSDLGWGAAGAATVTLSFWVRSSLTGTFSGSFVNAPTFNRSYPFTYTINAANTWEYKTITVAGDTSGTWGKTNGTGISMIFCIGAGSTNLTTPGAWTAGNFAGATGTTSVVGTNGATFYITGVQLEAGEQASGFEFMPIDVNLLRCQRYYYLHAKGNDKHICMGTFYTATLLTVGLQFPTEMRAAPSLIQTSGTNYYIAYHNNTQDSFNDFNVGIQRASTTACGMDCNANVSGTGGNAASVATFNASASIAYDAEL